MNILVFKISLFREREVQVGDVHVWVQVSDMLVTPVKVNT